jgi:hypothetical protein
VWSIGGGEAVDKQQSGYVDAIGAKALFSNPRGICVDRLRDLIFVADTGMFVVSALPPFTRHDILCRKSLYSTNCIGRFGDHFGRLDKNGIQRLAVHPIYPVSALNPSPCFLLLYRR